MEIYPHNHPKIVVGRQRLARAMGLLLSRNDLSHAELEQLATWAAPDEHSRSWLAKSQISTILNAKLPKPGPQIFLALTSLNEGLAHLSSGAPPDRPLPQRLRRLSLPPGPWFLSHPTTGKPLRPGEWFEIYCGQFTTDELEDLPEIYSGETAVAASEQLALLAQAWMYQRRLIGPSGREQIANLYRSDDRDDRERLKRVIACEHVLTGAELYKDRDRLRFLVGELLGRKALSVREFDRWVRGQLEEEA